MRKTTGWTVGVLVATGALAWLGWAFWKHPPKDDASAWAGWVQAFGSIAAILASGVIAAWQMNVTKRDAERDRLDRGMALVEAVGTLAHSFLQEMASMAARFQDRESALDLRRHRSDDSIFKNIELSVLDIPLQDLPDRETIKLMVNFRNLVFTSRSAVGELLDRLANPVEAVLFQGKPLDHLVAAAQANDEQWKNALKRLET